MKLCELMGSIIIATAATLSVPAKASSWLNCEVLAKVEEVRSGSDANSASWRELRIRLLRDPYSCEGHGLPKKHSSGQSLWVRTVAGDSNEITVDTELRLRHKVYQGMGPKGLVKSDEWSVLEMMQ